MQSNKAATTEHLAYLPDEVRTPDLSVSKAIFMTEYSEAQWHQLEQRLEQQFGKVPNMEALLFLIGMNEYRGRTPKIKFSKEQKQDLMHVAVCRLLSQEGYYELEGYDMEGWPHFRELKPVESADNLNDQEVLLKRQIIQYFEELQGPV